MSDTMTYSVEAFEPKGGTMHTWISMLVWKEKLYYYPRPPLMVGPLWCEVGGGVGV